MRAAFYTLGCKLNQYETESIADKFKSAGFKIVNIHEHADVFIINTCTVTTKSEQKARRIIRKISKDNKGSLVIVTGCYAQLERDKIKELVPNLIIISQDNKPVLLEIAEDIINGNYEFNPKNSDRNKFSYSPGKFIFHSRAFIKIQDGCDYMCTYCRVPLARGKSVSMDYKLVVNTLRRMEKTGYREAVLTGVNIASYKFGNKDFSDLLLHMLDNTENIRLRISSLEPEKINNKLMDIIKSERICSHFHLPVQSGSDKILRLMKRRYNSKKIIENTELLRNVKPDAFISADIIAGFPGETDEEFKHTKDLIKKCSFAGMHIFRFSRRPGTVAYRMKPVIPERTVKERVIELAEIEKKLHLKYIKNCPKTAEAVLEEKTDILPGIKYKNDKKTWLGLSDNYLKLQIINVPPVFKSGQLVKCEILNQKEIIQTGQKLIAEYIK
jgi:threonylcarbamoyladenosine tRNA methylthiotransferase MtaB